MIHWRAMMTGFQFRRFTLYIKCELRVLITCAAVSHTAPHNAAQRKPISIAYHLLKKAYMRNAHQIRINDLDLLVSDSSPYHFITLQFCCLFCCCYCCRRRRRYFILFILLLFVVWKRAHKFSSRFDHVTY